MATRKKGLTYAAAGVDTDRQKEAIRALAGQIRFQRKGIGAPLTGLTHFAGLIDFSKDLALALCTDGVGTKLEVARALRKWDTVGIDCIAMNVNDCICVGAEPLAFVDYIATEKPEPEVARQIGTGLSRGAELANVTLAGGETAILPDLVRGLDLAGTCVGVVPKKRIVDGGKIRSGDVILGLPSTGLHSNGFTLARRILAEASVDYDDPLPRGSSRGGTVGQVLLEPTRIYVKEILRLLGAADVRGLANITGGALRNIPRVNPGFRYVISDPPPVPPIFEALQEWGGVEAAEMYGTFNMGLGFVAIVAKGQEKKALEALKATGAAVIGRVENGVNCVHEPTGLEFESKA